MGQSSKHPKQAPPETLRGIWLLGPRELTAESAWLFAVGDTLVRGVSNLLGGKSVSVPRVPRRSGNQSFPFHLLGDLAQCLRYCRNESTMSVDYAEEVANTVATILGTRAIDLLDLDGFELRTMKLPVPDLRWADYSDQTVVKIIMATQARRLSEARKPIPLPLAEALTGWTEGELVGFEHGDSGQKMVHRKRKGIRYFEAQTFDLALESIETIFFDHRTYTPF